ncbi:50S ribosomal protein L6 [Candidatus Parvarchaeota archaeon]|uniref:50S ribosomal protein L6 n=1 Tax=Candidatus Acidifodinimicrobium mancum TaxID=2898728 RepID=A0A8T3V1J2_9ARCH|nr:50S ribosomal protein L6 [Candidatus Acidifodinimicrobium mancum]MBE5728288.1 50S ribosomal protein L6 [Candidatus Acidifodinimicrobium mancum]MBE5728943.1 50S ribosomal protein L6 [Candidatus Acidifodinimicrobium mancum]MBE5729608.1 50S ribosomal protein L6 [Candidatus Acidifodinimicrobium mancum]MBE5729920.1 50S ribosomal protein L6 [Candidatus Acidifodinimicrobium mancum]
MSTKFSTQLDGADVKIENGEISVSGPKGELKVKVVYSFLSVRKEENTLYIECKKDTDYQKAIAGTLAAQVRNMVKGVKEGYTAELELVYIHFPASMKLVGDKLVVENFVGERKAREIFIPKDVKTKVQGTKIILEGIDKYKVGQVAGTIEKNVQIKNKDRRVFKDGIFIVKKPE